jgi:hypothetical protein
MSRTVTHLATAVAMCAVAVLVGCTPKPPMDRPPAYWSGPTEPLASVVSHVNANNANITSLWSRHQFQAWLQEPGKKSITYVDGDGDLQYRAEDDFRLSCSKAGLGQLMTLGTNAETYWLTIKPELDTMWWGRMKYLGAPGTEPLPLDPTLIAQVLGVGRIDGDFLSQPVPVMRFNNDEGVYVITWNVRLANQWATQREVWYDRQSFLPVRVYLYDANGRALVKALLAEHVPVKTQRGQEIGGKVAGAFTLSFPDSGSRMILRLRDPLVSRNGFPKDVSFQLPLDKPGVSKVIRVDESAGP